MNDQAYDYLIIGSGAGGSAAAYKLVNAGKRVLLLEKGDVLTRDGSTLDPELVMRQNRWHSQEVWLDRDDRPFKPEEAFNLGGKTKWYGAALLRFARAEFEPDAALGLQAWPLRYDDLEPYYSEAEQLLEVRTVEAEPDLVSICRRLERQSGWNTAPLSLGLTANIAEHVNEAKHFDGFAIPNGLKADAEFRLLERIRERPNFTLVTHAEVIESVPSPAQDSRMAGVRCSDGQVYHANTILLAAGALHSPRLIQRWLGGQASGEPNSEHGRHEPWAAGRFFKRHILTAVLGFSWRPTSDLIRKTLLITHPEFPHSSVQPLGGWLDHDIVRVTLPRWLPSVVVEFFAKRVYGFFLQTEDASDERNRVLRGAGGPARLDYDLDRMPALTQEHRRFAWRFLLSLWRAGLFAVKQSPGLAGTAHACGTLVTGHDPLRSVVDAEGRVHGMDNLYVVDGSILPRIGRLNPSLTIYAWALRVADRLLRQPA